MAARKLVPLRLQPEIHAALRRWAADEFRSLNAQVEYLLHRALREADRLPGAPPTDPGAGGAAGNARPTGPPPVAGDPRRSPAGGGEEDGEPADD